MTRIGNMYETEINETKYYVFVETDGEIPDTESFIVFDEDWNKVEDEDIESEIGEMFDIKEWED